VVAVYSTFLQRAIDQMMHDVCLSNLPVVFCVDRAGVVGADGATHQGVFDIAMLRCLPNIAICQPKDEADMASLMKEALERKGPTVIRYPRGQVPAKVDAISSVLPGDKASVAIWATGDWLGKANEVARLVGGCEVVHARYMKPFDSGLLERQRADGMVIVTLENGCVAGGFGEEIGADMKFGWPDEFIPHGSQTELEAKYGLDAASIADAIKGRRA
jgi:1-deoxy-D-xylulose-5-phosphate synthase